MNDNYILDPVVAGKRGVQEDGHVPGLRWIPGTGRQVWVLGFAQERIQEQAIVKWEQVYLERYTFHIKNVVCLRKWEQPRNMR